jgi:hypothetical protein
MANVLLVNHKEKQCGVYQYGLSLGKILNRSKKHNIIYVECENIQDLIGFVEKYDPKAIIYNYYSSTLPWVPQTLSYLVFKKLIKICIIHEVNHQLISTIRPNPIFDAFIVIDPTAPETTCVINTPCMIRDFSYVTVPKLENVVHPVIGAFGFGFGNKGYLRVIDKVKLEYDEALIRLHIPYAKFGDEFGIQANERALECRTAVEGTKIQLDITHDFWTQEEVYIFLSQNDINLFLFDEMPTRGLSGSVEFALSTKTPIMINKTTMFRHLIDAVPSIFVEDTTIAEVIRHGTTPLDPYREKWSNEKLISKYEYIIDTVLE